MTTDTQTKNPGSSSHKRTGLLQNIQKETGPIRQFINKFNNDWVMNLAGIMAYNLMLAIFPIAIALLGIAGLVLHNDPTLRDNLITQADKIAGLGSLVKLAANQLSKDGGILVIIAILTAVFGGSRLFVTLEGILDILYRVRPRTLIRQNLIAVGMLILFIVLITIMVIASAIPSLFAALLASPTLKSIPLVNTITSGVVGPTLVGIMSVTIGLIFAFILFEAIYVIVPNQKISWRNSWKGAVTAAILLEIFLNAFPFYTTHFLGGYAGQIGLVIILLVFFYYFAVILLLGAEVNAYFSEHVQPLPNDLVTFVSTMGGKLNRDTPDAESDTHVDTHPTDSADKAHVSDELQHEEMVKKRNQHLQQQIASAAQSNDEARDTTKKQKKQAQSSGRWAAVLSAIAGTALAFLFQILQVRNHGK